MVLFATGGGQTNPPSTAGEVTPLEIRPLQEPITASVVGMGQPPLTIEYAGAAPGLVSGVTQINIKLPDTIPSISGLAAAELSIVVGYQPGYVTIAVTPQN